MEFQWIFPKNLWHQSWLPFLDPVLNLVRSKAIFKNIVFKLRRNVCIAFHF
jgi:hypothetical protein